MAGKIHGGTIQAELTADVSGYMSGLGQATQASQQFQRSVTGISFQGFNRGIIATTTLLYGMNRIMSQMSQGMEEFSNVLARIGSVADLTAESVRNLADSMKSVSVSQGVVRSDIMKAMYTTAQSRFTKPSEMRFFGEQSAMLSRASGKEIDAMGAAKLMTGLVRSLGLDVQKDVASGKLSDMLLKSRDIGRWELREMAPAIAKVATVFGNEFADRLGGIETLRQMNAIMAVASGTDLPLGMVSTGVRRLVERSYQLRGSGRGDYLRSQLSSLGYDSKDPITAALEKGPLFYLRDLAKLSGGSPMELYKLGFQSRELAAVSAAMSGKGSQLMSAYQQTAPGSISGLTGQYSDKMKNTYEFRRDQLRAEWQITAQEFMQASIPLIGSFTTALSGLNKVAQMLPDSVKSFMGLIAMLSSLRFALNLFGFKGSIFGISSKRMTGGGEGWKLGGAKAPKDLAGAASMLSMAMEPPAPSVQEQIFGRISGAIMRNSTLGAPVDAFKQGTEGFFGRTYNSIASSLKQRYMGYNQIRINALSGKYQARGARGRFLPTSDTLQDALIARTNSLPLDNLPHISLKEAVFGIGSLPQQLARMHGVRTSLAAQGRVPYLARELHPQGIGALLASFYGMSALPFDLLRYGAQRVMGVMPTLPEPGKNNVFRQIGQSARVGLASPISLPSNKWIDPHGFTSYAKLKAAERMPLLTATEARLQTAGHGGVPLGPSWYDAPRTEPMNAIQARVQARMQARLDAQRAASNERYWLPGTNVRRHGWSSKPYSPTVEESIARKQAERNARIYERYKSDKFSMSGKELYDLNYQAEPGMPTTRERLMQEAARRGEVIDFNEGTYRPRRLSDDPASLRRQLGRYMGMRRGFEQVGYSPTSQDYSAAGIGKFARILGGATSTVGRFASGLGGLIAPMAKMMVVMKLFSAIMDGINRKARDEYSDGMKRITPKRTNILAAIADSTFTGISAMSAALLGGGQEPAWDIMEEFAHRYGFIADPDSRHAMSSWGAWATTGQWGLKGFRRANYRDAIAEVWRNQLSLQQRGILSTAGVGSGYYGEEFGKFFKDYLENELKVKRPYNWNQFVASEGGFEQTMDYLRDAMAAFAKQLEETGVSLSKHFDYAIQTVSNRLNQWTSILVRSMDALLNIFGRNAIMFDRQWKNYKDFKAGQRDGNPLSDDKFRALYMAGIEDIREYYGGFANVQFTGDYHKKGTGGWLDVVTPEAETIAEQIRRYNKYVPDDIKSQYHGAVRNYEVTGGPKYVNQRYTKQIEEKRKKELGDFEDALFGMGLGPEYTEKVDRFEALHNKYARKLDMQLNAMQYLGVVPYLNEMTSEGKRSLFMEMTNRRPEGDPTFDYDLNLFSNPNIRDLMEIHKVGDRAQYAQATQFGSAEAYNELLQRDGPEYQILLELEKTTGFLEQLAYPEQETVESLYEQVVRKANTFFEQAENTGFFDNINTMAREDQ